MNFFKSYELSCLSVTSLEHLRYMLADLKGESRMSWEANRCVSPFAELFKLLERTGMSFAIHIRSAQWLQSR